MELEKRIRSFSALGKILMDYYYKKDHELGWEKDLISRLEETIRKEHHSNTWFTEEYVRYAIHAIAIQLNEENIKKWTDQYPASYFNPDKIKTIGVVMAGNIPLVGFFDFFYILMTGNIVKAKLSSQDKQLLPLLASALVHIEPAFKNRITFTDSKLKDIDAIIATGSDNTSRYFEYYFSKYPNIIRKNRNSVAVLTGKENTEELKLLGDDIFAYYGFGCRNVSKLYIPENYDLTNIFPPIEDKKEIINNHKYFNNYEYRKAIYLVNQTPHLDNGFLLLKEDLSLHSPVACLYYEFYRDQVELKQKLDENKTKIQCIVANKMELEGVVSFGNTQYPGLNDYADGVDVIKFISTL